MATDGHSLSRLNMTGPGKTSSTQTIESGHSTAESFQSPDDLINTPIYYIY